VGGTFIIENNDRIFLTDSSYDIQQRFLTAAAPDRSCSVAVVSSDLVEQLSQMMPELGITGPGYVLTVSTVVIAD